MNRAFGTIRRRLRVLSLLAAAMVVACAQVAGAAGVVHPYPATNPGDIAAAASAPLAGWSAIADTFHDRVEVRDHSGTLRRAITRQDISALVPWMMLDGGPDGPSALAFTASGRLLYILMHDDTVPDDGQPTDALLRYDLSTDILVRQARLDLYDRGDQWPHLAAAHYSGFLYVGTGAGQIQGFLAYSSASGSTPLGTWTVPGASIIHGVAIDRDAATLYAATDTGIFRAPLPPTPANVPSFTLVSTVADVRALAWGDHYGAPAQRGLYILRPGPSGGSRVEFIPAAIASSFSGVTPALYLSDAGDWHDLCPTADGRLLIAAGSQALVLADTADTRLAFESWLREELAQATHFARGLISPDGEPDGWVIDGDVLPGQSRFHPATPDGAAWAVLLLMMNERVNGDGASQHDVRRILNRYAGLSPDGIRPSRNADGIFKHWLSPLTGDTRAGWADEYATLSSMKIVAAAARAADFYPDDPVIVRAASRIIFLTRNWDAYLQPGSDALAFKALAGGGADPFSWSAPYHEGIIFAEQAGVYGTATAPAIANRWFARSIWPTASYLATSPITVAVPNVTQPAFLSLYPALISQRFRADLSPNGWRAQVRSLRWASAAFTDDNPARYPVVFSAGTSPANGGYNADTFASHPGNITTFTSLLALSAFGDPTEAVGGYAAYRKGARQTFKSGASILYRRSYDSGSFTPNSAGLPDVALGALGLAELIQPGSIDAVLARPYPTTESCPQDLDGDGRISIDDLYVATAAPSDLNGDGVIGAKDAACLEAWLRRTEPSRMATPQRP